MPERRTAAADQVDSVVATVERKLREGDAEERVEALDILTHALSFTGVADALDVWRAALHRRHVGPSARSALEALVDYLQAEHRKGNEEAARDICDCVAFVVETDGVSPTWA